MYIRDAPVKVKIKLIGSMFPEKLEFDGKQYRTNSYNAVLDLIYRQTNMLRGNKKGDSSDFPEKSPKVPYDVLLSNRFLEDLAKIWELRHWIPNPEFTPIQSCNYL